MQHHHRSWLFSLLCLLGLFACNGYSDLRSKSITVNAKDIYKCHSCLIRIAGMKRPFLSSSRHHMQETKATFDVSGLDFNFKRAQLDCQRPLFCGSITIYNQKEITNGHAHGQNPLMNPTTIPPTTLHSIAGTSTGTIPLCISFQMMQSVDCRNCLKVKARSPTMEVVPLVMENGVEKFVHIVFTQEENVHDPCILSDFCVGSVVVQSVEACTRLLKMRYPTRYNQGHVSVAPVSGAKSKDKSAHEVSRGSDPNGVCLKTSASHDHTEACFICLAKKASGLIVLVDHTTIQHKKVGENAEKSNQLIYLITKEIVTHPTECNDFCTTVNPEVESDCEKSYSDDVDSSPVEGEIFSRMSDDRGDPVTPHYRKPDSGASCLWVEHKVHYQKKCLECMQRLSTQAATELTAIDFLVLSEKNVNRINMSNCITSSDKTMCSKITLIPKSICEYYNREQNSFGFHFDYNQAGTIEAMLAPYIHNHLKQVSLVSVGNPTLDCFQRLVLKLDVLIISTIPAKFWMLESLSQNFFIHECGELRISDGLDLDVSSLCPMSSESLSVRLSRKRILPESGPSGLKRQNMRTDEGVRTMDSRK